MRKGILTMAWCFGLLAVVFASKPAYGAVEGMTLEEMVKEADIIVIGKTVDVTSRWESGGRVSMYTYVTFEVERYIKGKSVGDVIVIKHAGGAAEIPIPDEPGIVTLPSGQTIEFTEEDIRRYEELGWDTITVGEWVEDSPVFATGYRELLLLKKDGSKFDGKPVFGVVGAFQGKYTIIEDKVFWNPGGSSLWGSTMDIEINLRRLRRKLGRDDIDAKKALELIRKMDIDEMIEYGVSYEIIDNLKIFLKDFEPHSVSPLDELLDRIREIMTTGVIQTSWGKVKSFVSR